MTNGNGGTSWGELTRVREAAAARQQVQRRALAHKPVEDAPHSVAQLVDEARRAGALLSEAGFCEISEVRPGWRVAMRIGGRYVDTVAMREQDCHTQAIRQLTDASPNTSLWIPGAAEAEVAVEWASNGEPLDVIGELLALDNE